MRFLQKVLQALQCSKSPALQIHVSLDHVERTEYCLILGLKFAWYAKTFVPISVCDVKISLFNPTKREWISLFPQEHFIPNPDGAIEMLAGPLSFELPGGGYNIEHIRYSIYNSTAFSEGIYPLKIEAQFSDRYFVHRDSVFIAGRTTIEQVKTSS